MMDVASARIRVQTVRIGAVLTTRVNWGTARLRGVGYVKTMSFVVRGRNS